MNKLLAEFLGTFILVFGGCGSAVFAAGIENVGIGYLGVSLAFGLTVVAGAYAFGGISGGHFNPAVTVGLTTAGRFPSKDVVPYILVQTLGAVVASFALLFILQQAPGGYDVVAGRLAANGYGEFSPSKYSLAAGFVTEVILTFIFLMVILGTTSFHAQPAMAGLVIGLTLTLIHLVSIPITNCSVNPARSTGPAVLVGGTAIAQLWLFWVAPMLGAVLAGLVSRNLNAPETAEDI